MGPHHDSTKQRAGRRRPRPLVVVLVALLAPLSLAWVPAPSIRTAGPVIDLSRAMAAGPAGHARPSGQGRFLLTSVRDEHDALWLWATRSLVEPGWHPGATAAGPLNTLAQMQEAEADAWQVAVGLVSAPVGGSVNALAGNASGRPMPQVDTEGITGPSGGLMLALAFTDSLNQGDLTAGRTIAGTGTIDGDGNVGPIGYVTYKVRGAAAAGATVFFVPWDNAPEAERAASASMQVVPVATFADALGWLCRNGSADQACVRLRAVQPD